MAKDPYKLLGVPKTASEAEIRKAYRALAKKLHPDVNPGDEAAAERFKEISAAYNLLSDEDLRARYDSGQVDASGQQQAPFGFGQGGFGGGFQNRQFEGGDIDEMADLFSSLFGMNMGARTDPRRSQYVRPQKGADVRYKITLPFLEALKGGKKRVKMSNGKTLDVKIPEGVADGTTLRLRGKGEPGKNGGPSGDAKVDIAVKPHKYFTRDGDKLRLRLPISLQEAVLGGKIKIPMLSGSVQLNIPAGTNSGKTLRLRGKGIAGGDLLVTTQIVLENPNDGGLKTWAEASQPPQVFDPREVLKS